MNIDRLEHRDTFLGHEDVIGGVRVYDSNTIVSWSDDTTLRLWFLDRSTPIHVLRGHGAEVTHALSLPDGTITSTAYDGSLCIWDLKTGTLARKIVRQELSFMGTRYWRPKHVVSWDMEGNLIPWDISSGKAISILKGACFRYYEASMIPPFLLLRDRGVALSWPSITLEFWDLESGQCVKNIMEHSDAPEGAYLLSDGRILTWSNDRTLKIWTQDGIVEATLIGHENYIRNAFALDNGDIVSWSTDGTVRIWDASTTQPKCVFAQHNSLILQVWSLSTNLLLSQSFDGRCYVWDRVTGEICTAFDTGGNGGIVLSNSRFLNWEQAAIKLWDLNSGECMQMLNAHEGKIWGAKLINAKTVVTWSKDRTLRVWELA